MRTEAEQKGFTWKGIMITLSAFALITIVAFYFLTRWKKIGNQTDISSTCDQTPINADGTNVGIYESIHDTTEAENFAKRNYDQQISIWKLGKVMSCKVSHSHLGDLEILRYLAPENSPLL